MLKRLELVGFKSFADKTAFDFSPGITGIVGPNGSGKSNIVDAVRWVLGEQSAKSLRGGEMADVIFNGSTSRRSLGLAEVTMTFDNSRRHLLSETDEVQITRRVYRSGEGEYLINHQISRLKDIKNLFLGSGAGADAYCIIEQGRVDVLLQASTKDRRTIFEEAAGISRFKARKVETLRKLEHVDLNLQRLRDIIDEVEKQLRSVKLQAAKAQRYQEYSNRLKELRVALSLEEYRQLAEQLQAETSVLDNLRAGLAEQAARAETSEANAGRLEETLAKVEESVHQQESVLAQTRQQIAAEEATLGHESTLSADLETELARTRTRMAELNARVATLAEEVARAARDVNGVETQCHDQRARASVLEKELNAAVVRLSELNNQVQTDKAEHLEQMRQASRLQNDVVSFKAHVDNLRREHQRLHQRSTQAAESLASVDVELEELSAADAALQSRLGTARRRLNDQRLERERLRRLHDDTNQLVADLRAQRSGLASRIEVLEGLERSHEGLGTGVREVYELLERSPSAPWGTVLGMIADVLTVRREYAPLIDLALGERAQRFLVRDAAALDRALCERGQPFSGRVSFVPLTRIRVELVTTPQTGSANGSGLAECGANHAHGLLTLASSRRARLASLPEGSPPGLIALAEQLVTCDRPELADLPTQLLGNTLLVRDLKTARALAGQTAGSRFVTLQGELLEPDGTVTAGTHHAETGILSRKSELRELREQVAALEGRIAETERDRADLRQRVAALDGQASNLQEELDVLAGQASDLRSRLEQRRQHRAGLHQEVTLSRTEISGLEQEIQSLDEAWQRARFQAEEAEGKVQALQARLQQADIEIRECEQQRQQRQQECTTAKVALAQIEERLAALRAKYSQAEADLRQRRHEQAQGDQYLTAARTRLAESQRTMLQASSSLARWYLDKEAVERRLGELSQGRDQQRQQRHHLAECAQAARNTWKAQQEQAHARELVVNDLRHGRDTLVERLREDYQIDLAEVYRQAVASGQWPGAGEQDSGASVLVSNPAITPDSSSSLATSHWPLIAAVEPATVNEEIAELRRKLSRLGSVNLDSLQELTELETRARSLQAQSDDLVSAKRSLEEIIGKINEDSQRLFTETFSAIRTHFQDLFRKLFGGGMADIMFKDEADILDSGIEIVARPPGKELRSISLMSGGEKTMTAVALLLAIFRSKPSPFCILDEVDAALDETNIGRFTAVLREFLDQSHFIIITHSKRTMATADVLYGITMQESGISKRVAVRFEDWPEDGEPANGELAAAAQSRV